jgi:Xaa-Pro dipeptidase
MMGIRFDVDTVRLTWSLNKEIQNWLIRNGQSRIYALHKHQVPHITSLNYEGPNVDIESLQDALDACRVVESQHEISLVRHAVQLFSFAHRSILYNITSLQSEPEVDAHFIDICISHGARRQAYGPKCSDLALYKE